MRLFLRTTSVPLSALILLACIVTPSTAQETDAPQPGPGQMHRMHGQNQAGMQGMGSGGMLSGVSETEKEALLQGAGLGAGMIAMMNGYPGPKHVLEMGDELGLSAEQRETIGTIYGEGKARFVELGTELVAKDEALTALFESGSASTGEVEDLAREIGELQGELRAAHLNAHVETYEALSSEQRQKAVSMHQMHQGSGQGMQQRSSGQGT